MTDTVVLVCSDCGETFVLPVALTLPDYRVVHEAENAHRMEEAA